MIVKPILKGINIWKDLIKFRNTLLVHNLRNGKESVLHEFHSYDIPQKIVELSILYELIKMYKNVLYSAFEELIAQYQDELDSIEQKKKDIRFKTDEEARIFIEKIRLQTNKLIIDFQEREVGFKKI